jgi:phage head maturation protease
MRLYAEITKIDEAEQLVFGYASTEALDSQGEIVKREALEAALPDYMRFANIREMHQPSAVGVATKAQIDGKGLFLGAKIVDPTAWEKVVQGVYKGFSIGGKVTSRDETEKHVITGLRLSEISLVDRPANPEAVFTMYKSDECKDLEKIGARNSQADLALIQEIHDRAAALGAACGDDDDDDDEADGGQDDTDKMHRPRNLAKLAGELGAARLRIAELEAERDLLVKTLAAKPAERRAALRAMPIDKAADSLSAAFARETPTNDPIELTKRALRRPLSLAQIEKIANR